jgi:hypothetical protein
MKTCRVCNEILSDEKFSKKNHILKDGTKVVYTDSTCMVCRRKHYLSKEGKRDIHRKGQSNWYYNNPEKAKEQRLRRYGISLAEYNIIRENQNYRCACCGRHEEEVEQGKAKTPATSLQVDHCHDTGKVRGLLCTNCNTLLGKSKDDVSVLEAAIRYLKEHE